MLCTTFHFHNTASVLAVRECVCAVCDEYGAQAIYITMQLQVCAGVYILVNLVTIVRT